MIIRILTKYLANINWPLLMKKNFNRNVFYNAPMCYISMWVCYDWLILDILYCFDKVK